MPLAGISLDLRLLLPAGLYKGFTPGKSYNPVYLRTRVRLNALKLGIWFT